MIGCACGKRRPFANSHPGRAAKLSRLTPETGTDGAGRQRSAGTRGVCEIREMEDETSTSLRTPRASPSLAPTPPPGKASADLLLPDTWLCLHPPGTCLGSGGQRAVPRVPGIPVTLQPLCVRAGRCWCGLGDAGAGRGHGQHPARASRPGSEARCPRRHGTTGVSLLRPLPQSARAKRRRRGLSQRGPRAETASREARRISQRFKKSWQDFRDTPATGRRAPQPTLAMPGARRALPAPLPAGAAVADGRTDRQTAGTSTRGWFVRARGPLTRGALK